MQAKITVRESQNIIDWEAGRKAFNLKTARRSEMYANEMDAKQNMECCVCMYIYNIYVRI